MSYKIKESFKQRSNRFKEKTINEKSFKIEISLVKKGDELDKKYLGKYVWNIYKNGVFIDGSYHHNKSFLTTNAAEEDAKNILKQKESYKEKLKNLKESVEDEIKNLFYAGLQVEQIYVKLKNKYPAMDSGVLRDKIEKIFSDMNQKESYKKNNLKESADDSHGPYSRSEAQKIANKQDDENNKNGINASVTVEKEDDGWWVETRFY
jgi:hypothetical protein